MRGTCYHHYCVLMFQTNNHLKALVALYLDNERCLGVERRLGVF